METVTTEPRGRATAPVLLACSEMIDEISIPRTRIWGILCVCALGFLIGQLIAQLGDGAGVALTHYVGGVQGLSHASRQPWWASTIGLLGIWIGLMGATFWTMRSAMLSALPPSSWKPRFIDLGYLAMGIVAQLLVDAAYAPFHISGLNGPVQRMFGATHGLTFALLAVLTAFGAPVVEERFFRATLFRGLREGLVQQSPRAGTASAVVGSALLFGLAHGELVQLPGLFALGCVLAVVFQRTQRLTASVSVHVGFNLLAVGTLIFQRAHV